MTLPVPVQIGLLVLASIFSVMAIIAGVGYERARRRMGRIGRRGLR